MYRLIGLMVVMLVFRVGRFIMFSVSVWLFGWVVMKVFSSFVCWVDIIMWVLVVCSVLVVVCLMLVDVLIS